ncbi:DUF58 domain-containing protein [Thiomicrorhabdus sp. 6S2-11]|uniref:DUF58 domain-containing protein n=1 Tax=Thiomicrorhabdus marina TaxID=2818442 RepID=A0ABS3Q781_9GAMM|nr:DUF58 domain-containing protein [Thiomicrorhabdus marina]MBO1928184.1 DUF58 domain-containing protein [Thiomicrorhabdus marina]
MYAENFLPLSDEQSRALLAQLDQWQLQPHWGKHLSQQALNGAQSSRMQGSGSEFAESRPYAQGDEIRHLDWRLMARSGEAFSRRFEEPRQAQWRLLIDMRESMWFGTRRQFKISQALNLAALIAWQAQQNQVDLQLWVLAEHDCMRLPLANLRGHSLVLALFNQLNHPASYWQSEQGAESYSLAQGLSKLFTQANAGSRVFLLSDLHDLMNDRSFAKQLPVWQRRLDLQFLWLYDPAEVELPSASGLQLVGSLGKALRLDRLAARKAYQVWAQSHYQQIEQSLSQSGANYSAVSTQLGLLDLAKVYQQLFVHSIGVLDTEGVKAEVQNG